MSKELKIINRLYNERVVEFYSNSVVIGIGKFAIYPNVLKTPFKEITLVEGNDNIFNLKLNKTELKEFIDELSYIHGLMED